VLYLIWHGKSKRDKMEPLGIIALFFVGAMAVSGYLMLWTYTATPENKYEKRQKMILQRRKARASLRCCDCVFITDREMKTIKRQGIEKAAEILGIHPTVLARSLKIKYAKPNEE
jgi:hypothetical protein